MASTMASSLVSAGWGAGSRPSWLCEEHPLSLCEQVAPSLTSWPSQQPAFAKLRDFHYPCACLQSSPSKIGEASRSSWAVFRWALGLRGVPALGGSG